MCYSKLSQECKLKFAYGYRYIDTSEEGDPEVDPDEQSDEEI